MWGFIRGFANVPTLPVAIVEGGILFGVPAAAVGLMLTGLWSAGSGWRRQAS